jgi:HK97 family phage portal protein
MNLFQKAIRAIAMKSGIYGSVPLSLSSSAGWDSTGGSLTGRTVNDDTAMQVSVVWSCIRILSETIGALPMAVYEDKGNGDVKKIDHQVGEVLIRTPNFDMTSTEYREATITNLCLRGNSYSLKETNGAGELISLYPIPSSQVTPRRKDSGAIEYRVLERGKWETYPQEKIWHVKGFGSNGLVGYSPIGYVRQAMGLALATEEFGARFFSQGAKPSGFISVPEWLKDDQRKIARELVDSKFAGLENAQRLQLLEGGMKYESVTMPLEDAQFLETRRFQLDEICRIYRVPPHMVANLERATFSNIEHLSQEFVMYTLMPYLTRFEQASTKWLFRAADRGKYFLRFNVEGLLRADAAGRAQFYSQMLQNGVYSRNEVRALENKNRVDGLDDYTVQSNMTLVNFLEQLSQPKADSKAAAPNRGTKFDIHQAPIRMEPNFLKADGEQPRPIIQ